MRFIDMFCGMGTIRMGFEQAGHECVSAIEFDKHKRKIYEVIFGHEPQFSDITTVRGADLPSAGCWCFGAPCQDFSFAGKRAGLDGSRSGLVREVFRLLEEKDPCDRPEWLLYENVKGMLSSNLGWDFAEVQAEMGELGYDAQWQLLNSKDFGVPQNRERVYTLGHLRTRGRREVFPIARQGNKYSTIGQSAETAVARCLTAGAHSGGNHSGMTILKVGKVNSSQDGIIVSPNGICKTLTSGHFNAPKIAAGGIYTNVSKDFDRIENRTRRLTPRECMRLQGVPDYITDKLISAGISDTQMYRAAGDACTVNVIYEIAKRLV